jgi:hypothetical protein
MASGGIFLKTRLFFLCCPAAFLLFSCASSGAFARVDETAGLNLYAESAVMLEKKRTSLYKKRDTVLYYLDKGMLCHYAGQYEDSSRLLEDGERDIEASFTKSVTQAIGSYLFNDNTVEYGGEDYENIYINAFNALNYYHRGEVDGALVEIRRMSGKLENLASRYNMVLSDLQKQASGDNFGQIPPGQNAGTQFNNSALARYLGMLFYRGAGLYDDARIDSEWLRAAYAGAPGVYNHPMPSSIAGELEIPGGSARLNVIAFSGLSPVKREKAQRITLPGGHWAKIAYPEMVSRHSEAGRIEVVFEQGGGFHLELLENIEAVARETFKARQQVLFLKTVIRAMIKGIGSTALDAAAEAVAEQKGEKRKNDTLLDTLSFLTQIFADVSERADVRVSRYFPARAWAGGINVPPGNYTFQVIYYSKAGMEISRSRFENCAITENTLNLFEAICLR